MNEQPIGIGIVAPKEQTISFINHLDAGPQPLNEVEVYKVDTDSWIPCRLKNVVKGDKFRMYDVTTGKRIVDARGNTVWIAKDNATYNPTNATGWFVTIED